MSERMDQDKDLWRQRPMDTMMISYAAGDVASLCLLATAQKQLLGPMGAAFARKLSAAMSQCLWDAEERTHPYDPMMPLRLHCVIIMWPVTGSDSCNCEQLTELRIRVVYFWAVS